MPKWIHDRANYLKKQNPDMKEETAWALATQQGRAAGKVSKEYGTKQGKKDAKKKYKKPASEYEKKAKPKKKKSQLIQDLVILANRLDSLGFFKIADKIDRNILKHLDEGEEIYNANDPYPGLRYDSIERDDAMPEGDLDPKAFFEDPEMYLIQYAFTHPYYDPHEIADKLRPLMRVALSVEQDYFLKNELTRALADVKRSVSPATDSSQPWNSSSNFQDPAMKKKLEEIYRIFIQMAKEEN